MGYRCIQHCPVTRYSCQGWRWRLGGRGESESVAEARAGAGEGVGLGLDLAGLVTEGWLNIDTTIR